MLKRISDFEKKTPSNIEFEEIELRCGKKINVYTIKSVNDLTQLIGYGKYINNQKYNVLMRGQTDLYNGCLIPSFYRGKNNLKPSSNKYSAEINSLKSIKLFADYERVVLEPMLQHYGIKTTYLDLVDNVWVALWFSLYQAKSKYINSHEYIYYYENENEFSYIVLVASDAIELSTSNPGVYTGKETVLVDLRKALPSYFLRPHAQHAYMVKKKGIVADYSDLIVGIAKIPTELGIKWLGHNEFLNVRSLFPAAYFDSGYGLLLKNYPDKDEGYIKQYGSIQIVTD